MGFWGEVLGTYDRGSAIDHTLKPLFSVACQFSKNEP